MRSEHLRGGWGHLVVHGQTCFILQGSWDHLAANGVITETSIEWAFWGVNNNSQFSSCRQIARSKGNYSPHSWKWPWSRLWRPLHPSAGAQVLQKSRNPSSCKGVTHPGHRSWARMILIPIDSYPEGWLSTPITSFHLQLQPKMSFCTARSWGTMEQSARPCQQICRRAVVRQAKGMLAAWYFRFSNVFEKCQKLFRHAMIKTSTQPAPFSDTQQNIFVVYCCW